MGRCKFTRDLFPAPFHKKILQRFQRSFSVIEYAFLIAIITAALIGMAVYIKRAISQRWRAAVDEPFGHGRQYDPRATQK